MWPFATADVMSARSQGAITLTTHPHLNRELAAATRTIRNFCRWHVAELESLTYRRVGRDRDQVWLPAMQIQAVTAVTIDGTAWSDLSEVEFDPETGWTNLCGRNVAVTYQAGFTSVPEDIEQLTLELAAGGLGTSQGFSREQAGGVSVTYDRAGGGLTAADELRLSAYQLGRLP